MSVIETKRGRCGEYSMLLYRMLRILGYHEIRWVVDWSDHVWVEVYLGMKNYTNAENQLKLDGDDNVKVGGVVVKSFMTTRIAKLINAYLGSDDGPGKHEYNFSVINLSENNELKAYDQAFPEEKARVEQLIDEGLPASSGDDINNFIDLQLQECILHDSGSQSLSTGSWRRHHYFYLQDDETIRLSALFLTFVYQGSFDRSKYLPGTMLSVNLRRFTEQQTTEICIISQVPNTKNSLGHVSLKYSDPNHHIIAGGLFELEVTTAEADHAVSYSFRIGGTLACPLMKELRLQLARLIAKQREVRECIEQSMLLSKQMILLEREKTIEKMLIEQTEIKQDKNTSDMERLDLELDKQDEMDVSVVHQIIQKISVLKLEHEELCRLLSLRSRILDGISSDIRSMIEKRDIVQQHLQKLKDDVDNIKILLVRISSRISDQRVTGIVESFSNTK